ncbi:MAG: 4-hydroxy-3-methylbut-2-enyl diphosphate reductase, partial [Niameybacter sp.]
GIESIEHMDHVPMDQLIIRAHGVPEEVYQEAYEKSVHVIDATCPYVTKIHKLVSRHEKEGFNIILIGDANHPEIIGINGWTKKGCIILKNKSELDFSQLSQDARYFIVSQTTYKKAVVDEIVEALEQAGYNIKFMNTICSATSERQNEAREMASQVEAMVVIGSRHSSNTQKLYEICGSLCPKTYCIDDASMLKEEDFEGIEKVGVTAGASTPADVIDEVLTKLQQI